MNNPTLYIKQAYNARKYTRTLLKNHFKLKTLSTIKKSVLDIGCGPGNVTNNILFPILKENVSEIIGVDISNEMVKYATDVYRSEILTFLQINVAENIPQDFLGRFDNIFSFWTFQWISDQRKLYSNILKMLKPKGELFAIFVANSNIYDIYSLIWNKEKWAQYVKYTKKREAPFQNSKNPAQDLMHLLETEGFKDTSCVIHSCPIEFLQMEDMNEFIASITPECKLIPKDQQKEFIQEHVNLLESEQISENVTKYCVIVNAFVVSGSKCDI